MFIRVPATFVANLSHLYGFNTVFSSTDRAVRQTFVKIFGEPV